MCCGISPSPENADKDWQLEEQGLRLTVNAVLQVLYVVAAQVASGNCRTKELRKGLKERNVFNKNITQHSTSHAILHPTRQNRKG
jgi:hypothetical protein